MLRDGHNRTHECAITFVIALRNTLLGGTASPVSPSSQTIYYADSASHFGADNKPLRPAWVPASSTIDAVSAQWQFSRLICRENFTRLQFRLHHAAWLFARRN